MPPIFHSITIFFIESAQPQLAGRILDFRLLSCSDGSGKYQNKEKPLKRQRKLGLLHSLHSLESTVNPDLNPTKSIRSTLKSLKLCWGELERYICRLLTILCAVWLADSFCFCAFSTFGLPVLVFDYASKRCESEVPDRQTCLPHELFSAPEIGRTKLNETVSQSQHVCLRDPSSFCHFAGISQ